MTNFFISYNKTDRAWAEWIAHELERQEYTTILQDWDFRPSQNFVIKMDQAIRDSERIIAVLSHNYLKALFTHAEWAAAFAQDPTNEKGILLPIRVQECDLKGLFNQIIYIDFVGKNEDEARESLLAGVQTGRAKPLIKPDFPGDRPKSIATQPSFPGVRPPRIKVEILKLLIALVALFVIFIAAIVILPPSWVDRRPTNQFNPRVIQDPRGLEFPGLTYLGLNTKGYHEYGLDKDKTVILIFIPGGIFLAGAQKIDPRKSNYDSLAYPDETLRKQAVDAFFLAKYEITNAQYLRFCKEMKHPLPPAPNFPTLPDYMNCFPNYPVVNISWDDAKLYCDWAGLTLPTEAQWEFAARGSEGLRYPWGSEEPDDQNIFRANYSGYRQFEAWLDWGNGGQTAWMRDGFLFPAPIGSFSLGIGPFGHYNQAGNVWEWCKERYDSGSKSYIYKGGAFGSTAAILRPAYRNPNYPAERADYIGFRPARGI